MRKYLAVALVVLLALGTQPPPAQARGDIWSAKAIRALEGLLSSTGDMPLSTNTATTGVTVTGSTAGATLGSDVVVNGTFTGNATGWTLGGGGGAPDWAYASNNVTHGDSGGTTALQPSAALTVVAGTVYKVQFTISNYVAGTLTVSIGGTSASAVGANGTYNYTLAASNTANLLLTPTTTFNATVDTISVQTVTASAASFTITDGTTPEYFRVGPTSQRNFCIGDSQVCQYLSTGSSNNLCIGGQSCIQMTSGSVNTVLGPFAGNAITNGTENTLLGIGAGQNLKTGDRNTIVGRNGLANAAVHDNNQNACVGYTCLNAVTGDGNTSIGYNSGASAVTVNYSIALGHGADFTASNQLVIGGDDVAAAGITTAYIGRGVTNSAPPATVTVNGTGGSGSNIAGTSLTVGPGISTGTGVAAVNIQRNLVLTTGSTAQTQVPGMTFCPRKILSTTTATAQTVAIVDLPSNSAAGGEVHITVTCSDGTNFDSETQSATWSAVNKAGTLTLSTPTITASSAANNSGSCTIGFTIVAGTNQVLLKVTPAFTTIVPTSVFGYVDVITHQPSATAVACQ